MKHLVTISLILLTTLMARASDDQKIEVLIGYIRDSQKMIFQVYSGGCTSKEDFQTVISHRRNKSYLTLYRVKPDFCKAFFPFGQSIVFSYDELNISNRQSVQVLNPINPGFIF